MATRTQLAWITGKQRKRLPRSQWPENVKICLQHEQLRFNNSIRLIEAVEMTDGTIVLRYEVSYETTEHSHREMRLSVFRAGMYDKCPTGMIL